MPYSVMRIDYDNAILGKYLYVLNFSYFNSFNKHPLSTVVSDLKKYTI